MKKILFNSDLENILLLITAASVEFICPRLRQSLNADHTLFKKWSLLASKINLFFFLIIEFIYLCIYFILDTNLGRRSTLDFSGRIALGEPLPTTCRVFCVFCFVLYLSINLYQDKINCLIFTLQQQCVLFSRIRFYFRWSEQIFVSHIPCRYLSFGLFTIQGW